MSVERPSSCGALEHVDLLERVARAEHDAGERVVGERDRHVRLRLEALGGSRAAARRRRRAGCRAGSGRPPAPGGVFSSASLTASMISVTSGSSASRVSALVTFASRGRPVAGSRPRTSVCGVALVRRAAADLELDRLGGGLADRQPVVAADVAGQRLVEVVAAHAQRARHHDPAERDHGHLAGAAADVDDHVGERLARSAARRRSPPPSAPRSAAPSARRPPGTPPPARAARRR